jgi:multidrug efflux pump subunit AcrB
MGPKGWLLLAGAAGIATGAVIAAGKGMKGMRDAATKAANALKETNEDLAETSKEGEKTGEVLEGVFDDDNVDKYNAAIKQVDKTLQ